MAANSDGDLHIYALNVGQADTTVIVSPQGNIAVIDAYRPSKLVQFLSDLGIDGTLEHLIITHPHSDHFQGGSRLCQDFDILRATFAPFWHEFGVGPATYRSLISRLEDENADLSFLSGYSRWYPDDILVSDPNDQNLEVDVGSPFLEFLGPTNSLIRQLQDANNFNANHLTIMSRINWKKFRMIVTGDAQQENWAFFDQERLMEEDCQILRASHHGSSNGTQWERLSRLDPKFIIVSSDPTGGHSLPDLASTGVFTKFDNQNNNSVVITHDTGSIHIRIKADSKYELESFGEAPDENVDLSAGTELKVNTDITNWIDLLNTRIDEL